MTETNQLMAVMSILSRRSTTATALLAAAVLLPGAGPRGLALSQETDPHDPPEAVAGETLVCPTPPVATAVDPAVVGRYLAADDLEGRLAGSPGARCAGDFIARQFELLGLEPAGEDGTFFQPLPLASSINPHAPSGTGRNLVALLRGDDPDRRSEVVIIGAHYDHLGRGPFGSLEPDANEIHNGADDNASGVAALLETADRLAHRQPPARSILFIAFTGEEFGLLGSAHYTRSPTISLERAVAMLNLDMVGRLGAGPLIVYGIDTAAEWEELVSGTAAELGVEVAFNGSGYGPSDHTSFYSSDVPVLHFFTNVHSEYHKPSDDWELIDVEGLFTVSALVAGIAERIAERPTRLTLQRTEAPPPAREGGYGAYLGTVPDFAPVDFGVRLSGVRAGSPAEQAGMQKGDVLIRFDGEEIEDLYVFTDALRSHAPGDTVKVVVLREGEEVPLVAVLGSRGERE
jgi:hypothetical protein